MTRPTSSTAVLAFTIAALLVLQATSAQLASGVHPNTFVIKALPGLPGSTFTEAWAINNRGQIVGESASVGAVSHAVRWDGDAITDLGTLGGDFSQALDVNDRGDVVGYSDVGGGVLHAALWAHGTVTDLGTLGGTFSAAAGINNRGQVVGWSDVTTPGESHAFLWDDGAMIDLGTLPEGIVPSSIAWAINDRAQIVGVSSVGDGSQHAFLWEQRVMIDLGVLPAGSFSSAVDINAHGQIVGVTDRGSHDTYAFLWQDGVMTDLGNLPGGSGSFAKAINNRGEIVGEGRTMTGDIHAICGSAAPCWIWVRYRTHAPRARWTSTAEERSWAKASMKSSVRRPSCGRDAQACEQTARGSALACGNRSMLPLKVAPDHTVGDTIEVV